MKKEPNYTFPSGNPRPQPVPDGYKVKIPTVGSCLKCGRRHVSWKNCEGKSKVGKIIDTRPGCLR